MILLAHFFQACLVHEYFSDCLLIEKMIPLIKNKNGDVSSMDNYRSIALSSIFLKIWDCVILLVYGDKLEAGSMQFGFQSQSGTELCTWTLIEAIDYYVNRGSKAYVCYMDCSKAFDKVLHSKLFAKIHGSGIHPLFSRLLLYSYQHQSAAVSWEGSLSRRFLVRNGVRQGAVLSPVLFNFYTSELFSILSKCGAGARIDDLYYGLFGYADDLGLLSSTLEGLQTMLKETEKYAEEHNIMFSTNDIIAKSKTKASVFGLGRGVDPDHHLVLNNKALPWVDKAKYLGSIISNGDSPLLDDMKSKRARYIDNVHSLSQEFAWAHPAVKCQINDIYNTSIYGANLYPLGSKFHKQLINSHSTAVRLLWDLPRNTHRYLIESLSGRHLQTKLLTNMLGFYRRLEGSHKPEVGNLFRIVRDDVRTTTGANCRILENIGVEMGLIPQEGSFSEIELRQFKKMHRFAEVPSDEVYRIGLLNELLSIKTHFSYFEEEEFSVDDVNSMIIDICTS